ncbi:MAG TPA: universal stress protein [Candidatus Bathyarchaeia archaeon]|nr:universal stress protein [Candidatus Bathyarchaeia archaeon]
MKVLDNKPKIAVKNILFATDFEVMANRALPFAVALAGRYGARLYAAHVIPQEAYALARPESIERILKEAQDYARYALNQVIGPLGHRGYSCEALVGEGSPGEVITEFSQTYAADLVVLGTSSRAGLGKLFLGSVAEEVIREAPCPVLTVGPHVVTDPSAGIQRILCAADFSMGSVRAVQFATSLAYEYRAHLTLLHVIEGILKDSPDLAMQLTEKRLLDLVPPEPELQREPEVVVEIGPVAERILRVANELSADLIAMGVRGAGAFAPTASHFGSIAHKVVSLASCPVLTFGGLHQPENNNEEEQSSWNPQRS